jgi:hypothetical protein
LALASVQFGGYLGGFCRYAADSERISAAASVYSKE